ncbi:MAG: hypothetical protein V8K32_11360 [Candidatus Electrothrix gigas]
MDKIFEKFTGSCFQDILDFGRIYELGRRQFSVPGVETPGYFRQPLRDTISRIFSP